MRKKIYVRRKMDSWRSIKVPIIGGEVPLSGDGIGSCGLLVAFSTKRAFKKEYPKEEPMIFRLSK